MLPSPDMAEPALAPPGASVVLDVALAAPIGKHELSEALKRAGFARVETASLAPLPLSEHDNVVVIGERQKDVCAGGSFVVESQAGVWLRSTDRVRWRVTPLAVRAFTEVKPLGATSFEPHALATDADYHLRLVVREKRFATKRAVERALEDAGFDVALACRMRAERVVRAVAPEYGVWVAIARWLGPETYVVLEDDFYYEQVAASR